MKYTLKPTSQFKKDLKLMKKRGNDLTLLEEVLSLLADGKPLAEKFESVNAFIDKLKEYIYYYNNERISLKLKGKSPIQYRTQIQIN